MNGEELIALANKILNKEASEAEVQQYNAWYNARQHAEDFDIADAELKKAAIYARVEQAIELKYAAGNVKVRRLWQRAAGVAAAVAAVVFGIWFYTSYMNTRHYGEGQNPGSAQYVNDIAPGKNTATLTLANGKVIDLSDAKTGVIIDASKLTYNDGSLVRNASVTLPGVAEQLTASTPRGGTYTITLPDGTKVWLNAASSLTFPSHFANVTTRRVELSGEAYFEVFKNEKQPFVVNSKKLEVTVLGTHFNISSYADEAAIKTTLLEGSVRVTSLGNPKNASGKSDVVNPVVLKPDQQAILSGDHAIQVKQVDVNDVVDWKDGDFVFKHESLEQIMKRVARWYDIEIIYGKQVDRQQEFGGKVSRLKNISEVLKIMQSTGQVKFKIEGRRVYVE